MVQNGMLCCLVWSFGQMSCILSYIDIHNNNMWEHLFWLPTDELLKDLYLVHIMH